MSRLVATAAAAGALLTLAGCSGAESTSAPPPPPPAAAYRPAPPPVELAGAPPARPANGLAGGPPPPPPRAAAYTASMAPIANPLDLSPAERHRIYGYKYDRGAGRGRVARAAPAVAYAPARTAPARTAPVAPVIKRPAAPAPIAVKPVAQPAAKPVVVAKATPVAKPAPVVAAKPITAKPVAKPVPVVKLDPKTAKLQAALTAPVAGASTLSVAPAISTGQPGAVALTLPANLLDLIKQQATKLGLTRAARTAEVSATLTGQGYTITPNGAQTAKLKNGEAPAFTWQVSPLAGVEHSGLTAQVQAILRGEKTPRSFSLAAIEKAVTVAIPEPVKTGFLSKLDLSKLNIGGLKLPDYGDVNVPGIGKASSRTLIGAGLVLAAIILLLVIAARAAEAKARARRRRKFRTMADYGAMEAEPAYDAETVTTVHSEPEAATTQMVDVPHDTVVEHHPVVVHQETAAEEQAEAEMTDEERKANWPWRKDEETAKIHEPV